MLVMVVGIIIVVSILYVVWVNISAPSPEELDREIEENEALLAESRALLDEILGEDDARFAAHHAVTKTRLKK